MTQVLKDYIVGLRHVGFIVPSIKESLLTFKRVYGISDQEITITPPYDEACMTRFAFFKVGGQEYELIEAVTDDFKETLHQSASAGGGLNHLAYAVRNIEGALDALNKVGVKPGHVTPDGIVDFGKRKMVYLDPETTDGLLIELIEDIFHDS
ncbi:VOC family protein [Temperatibacter marinus]|uniref:VOC family protein n=1 Tax=Temperatibacter marinus TaxID=1456591 RepID=A0AA52HA30_9PROT|nr:VOC family protein [Temperatibacter marinus]WND03549.1 VOC family protein [Temperatibacter marinus]